MIDPARALSEPAHPWGAPPWKPALPVPQTPLPDRVRVAVVGAGFTGLAAARALARRGWRVAVLEAARVGAGASGRTGGLVLEDAAAGRLADAHGCIPALERRLRASAIDCDLRLPGCWELVHRGPGAPGPPGWRDGGAQLCAARTVAGGTLDPSALLSGLLRAALAAGATVHERAPVRRVETGGELALDLGARRLRCERVLLGLNAWTRVLLPEIAGVHAALTLALSTEPPGEAALAELGLGGRRPFYTVDRPYLWGRVLSDGGLLFGAGLAPAPDGDPAGLRLDAGEAAARLAQLESRVRGLHPALAGVRVAARWGGPVAFRRDGRPLLGPHPADPRVVVTGAYAGHGVALSVRVGELAAAAIAGERALPDWGRFALAGLRRPRGAP